MEALRRSNLRLRLVLAALLLTVLVIALGGGLNEYACQTPGIHGLCQHYGWGGVPTLAQEAELAAAATQGCDGLRQYLGSAVQERLRAKAQAAIDARRTEPYPMWVQQPEVPQPITLILAMAPSAATEAEARAASEARLLRNAAQQKCEPALRTTLYQAPAGRPLVRLENLSFACENHQDQVQCAAQADFICQADQLTENTREICNVAP